MTTTPPLDLARLNVVTDEYAAADKAYRAARGSFSLLSRYSKAQAHYLKDFNPQTARLLLDRLERAEKYVKRRASLGYSEACIIMEKTK